MPVVNLVTQALPNRISEKVRTLYNSQKSTVQLYRYRDTKNIRYPGTAWYLTQVLLTQVLKFSTAAF